MPQSNKKRNSMIFYVALAFLFFMFLQFVAIPAFQESQTKYVPYSEFLTKVENKSVKMVDLKSQEGSITFSALDDQGNEKKYKTGVWPEDGQLVQKLQSAGAIFTSSIPSKSNSILPFLLFTFGPLILLFGLGYLLYKKLSKAFDGDGPSMSFGGMSSFGKSGAKIYAQTDTGISFKDVAGQDEAKEALTEIVDFLHKPKRYENIGAKLPKGALLVGPPGTGKTLLAKAVAGEAHVPFFSMSGSEFVEMFVGRGAAKVRDLFKQAADKAPCIVFIDEIDTIGKKRDMTLTSNDEREQTLNQLLTEMDGFDNHKGIVVLGATNRPDSLDPALLRPGRFDRRVPVELPDLKGRQAILELHAQDVKSVDGIDYNLIARATSGASGADLANIVNEAALRAVRLGRNLVIQEDLEESVETVIAGQQRKNAVMDAHEKKIVAYHEIGHALVAAKQKGSAPVTKITIIPRTSGALGYTMQVEEQDKFLMSKEDLLNQIAVLCGGRAAEEVVFGSITTGASNDIERVTKIARSMVARFGMSEEFGFVALGQVQNRYLGGDTELSCSDGTTQQVDVVVKKIIDSCYAQAVQTLKENKFKLHELAAYLFKKETITGDEFMQILNRDELKFGKSEDAE